METQKIINLWNVSNNEESKFASKKWCVIDTQSEKDKYYKNNFIKFETESVKLSLCVYSDAYVLVTGDIAVNTGHNTDIEFKNCVPFSTCKTD